MTTHEEWLREQVAKGAEIGEAQADREMYEAIGNIVGRDAETVEAGCKAFTRMAGMMGSALRGTEQVALDVDRSRTVVGLVPKPIMANGTIIGHASAEELEQREQMLERQSKRDEAQQAFRVICALAAGSPETPAPELAERARAIVHAFRAAFPYEPFGYGY